MFRQEMTPSEYVRCSFVINQAEKSVEKFNYSETKLNWRGLNGCALVIYIQPTLCLTGLLFNGACIGVFMNVNKDQYYRKTSLIFYLESLSVCNILQLLLSIFVIVMPALEQFMDDERFPLEYDWLVDVNSKTVRFAYPLLMAANYSSIWILALICAQRFQSICHPTSPWKNRLNFVRRSKLLVFCVVSLAIVINVIRLWELQPTGGHDVDIGETTLRTSIWYKIVQEGLVYGFIVFGVPIIMLLWLNYNTFRIVMSDDVDRCRPVAEHRTALMTCSVFVFFFLFNTMSVSLRLVMILCGNLFLYPEYIWMVDLSNLLMNLNALAMPVVCFAFTRGFKDLFFAVRYLPTPTAEKPMHAKEEVRALDSDKYNDYV